MNETTNFTGNWLGNVNTTPLSSNTSTGLTLQGNPTINYSNNLGLSQAVTPTNQNNMVRQVKAAVFTVTRNEDNKVVSAEFVKEMWVEIKNGSSLDLAVAKELKGDYDPSTTVVSELLAVNFS